MTSFEVIFFSQNRRSPILEFVGKLSKIARSKVARTIETLETYGPDIGMPNSKN